MWWVLLVWSFVLGLFALHDVYIGVRLFNEFRPLPDRKDIKWNYISNGAFALTIAILFLVSLFKG